MRTAIGTMTCALVTLCLGACGGEAPPPVTPPATAVSSGTIPATATFGEQVAAGQQLYEAHCASCHGANGEGKKGPPLVGVSQGALPLDPPSTAKRRKNQFHTAADVADFVTKNMPADAPGSLTADQYWAILAFDLKANGVDLGTKHFDATVAPTVVIHP